MTTKPDHEYGLIIEPVNRYGAEYIEVRLARREEQYDHPVGCPSDGETLYGYGCPKHLVGLALDGLGMYGFISDSSSSMEPAFIAYDVEYRDVHASGEPKLQRMIKAIKKVNARITKDQAREPGDKFMAFAKALKLSFAVTRIGPPRRDPEWAWMSIEEGRNRYRGMIETAVDAAKARKVA